MMEWQPIESAPSDIRGIFYIVWDFREPTTALGEIHRCPGGGPGYAGPATFCVADGHSAPVPATHWMSLPDPPNPHTR